MPMLTPTMTFPAFFRTNDGREAIVVGHHTDAYVGLVRSHDGERLYPYAWTAAGECRCHSGHSGIGIRALKPAVHSVVAGACLTAGNEVVDRQSRWPDLGWCSDSPLTMHP
jgi:hypothetical protein